MTTIIPSGKRIYLTKKNQHSLHLYPGKILLDDVLEVAYDVRIDGHVVIPRGTKVLGDWISETYPNQAAQLQVKKIFLDRFGSDFTADSDIIENLATLNTNRLRNKFFVKTNRYYRTPSNIKRYFVNDGTQKRIINNERSQTPYLQIYTTEIPVTLLSDFHYQPDYLAHTDLVLDHEIKDV